VSEEKKTASGRGALAELKEAVTGLFDQVVGMTPDFGFRREYPKHELQVEDDGYLARVEVPGLRRDEVDVSISGRALSISGERPRFKPPTDARMIRSERPSGEFTLAIRLPAEVDAAGVAARVRDGVLEIKLPKPTAGRGRNVDVEADEPKRASEEPSSHESPGPNDDSSRMPWEDGPAES